MSPKTSLIVTVLNEEHTIELLLESIVAQSVLPAEVVIVDGGSRDRTLKKIQHFAKRHRAVPIVAVQKKGNRSVGRNTALALAKYQHIAVTDAGCTLAKDWLKHLLQTRHRTKAPVVSGYYSAEPTTKFQSACIPFVLVMPDKVNPETFLPATRSLLLDKVLWSTLGGFDETLSDNEDYAFAKKIERLRIPRAFARDAVVFWHPPTSLRQFFYMLYRFARGDIFAGIVRPKVLLLFARYVVALVAVALATVVPLPYYFSTLFLLGAGVSYLCWAVAKNYRYAPQSWLWFPVLQVVADIAVMSGSLAGCWQRLSRVAPFRS